MPTFHWTAITLAFRCRSSRSGCLCAAAAWLLLLPPWPRIGHPSPLSRAAAEGDAADDSGAALQGGCTLGAAWPCRVLSPDFGS